MRIRITCRQTTLTPDLRAFAEERIHRLERYVGPDADVHVVISSERHLHTAEMLLVFRQHQFAGTAVTSDVRTSLTLVLDRIDKQLRRQKRRRAARRRRHPTLARRPSSPGASGRRPTPRPVSAGPARFMSVDEAMLDLDSSDRDFVVFRNNASRRMSVVFRGTDGQIGLLEAD